MLIIEFLISWLAVYLATLLVPGVQVDGFTTSLIVAIVLALVNLVVGTLARAVTAPLNFLTLGLISFLISGLMVILTDKLVDGFTVTGYIPALLFALVLALIRWLFGMGFKK